MTDTTERELSAQQRTWLEHWQACRCSGKTMREYAAEAGISVSSFYGAKKRLVRGGLIDGRRDVSAVTFTRASIVSTALPQWHVGLANGVSVSFSGTVDGATLTTVLRAAAMLG